MNAERPRISIILPVYNRCHVVGRAIDSVLAQNLTDFELIVVDDGSSDGSADLVTAIPDPRLRLVRQPARKGANAARNRGIRESRAPLIAFLDSDDAFLPDKLSTVLAAFDGQPDLGTLVDSYAIVNPSKRNEPEPLVNAVILTSEEFLAAMFTSTVKSRRIRKATSGMTVRRDIALRAGLFDEKVDRRQDMEFLARLAKTARCATTDCILWTKYEQPDSISFTGGGFIASTLLMHRSHPEYSKDDRNMPADVVIYLCETLQRRRYYRALEDIRMLAGHLGIVSTLSLILRGAWAWLVDSRLAQRKGPDQAS
ncbi:MAG: glycosyltransferase family 2 protein [Pseudomonadota bacterium]